MQPVFFERDFSNRVQPMLDWSARRLRWTDEGGPDAASLEARGDWGQLWELTGMLRAPVEIHAESDMGERAWWGFVNEVRIVGEGYSITVGLDTMTNRLAVVYTLVEAGADATGERATTSFVEDALSVAEYGTKEGLINGGSLSAAAAENKRDTSLAAYKGPQPAISWGKSDAVYAEVHCKGWMSTLGWKLASWASVVGLSYATGSTDQSVGAASANQRVMQQVTNGASAINALSLTITGRKVGTPADNLTLELYALDGSGDATGSALASGSIAGADVGTTDAEITVTLSSEYEWAGAAQLGLTARRSGSVDGSNYFVWRCDTGVGYSGGTMKLYNGSAWSNRSPAADGRFVVEVNNQVLGGTQIQQLVSTYGQFITAQVFEVSASSTPALPSYRDGDTDALGEILALMRAGTTNDRRITCLVDQSRRAIWGEEPASSVLAYRVMREGLILDESGAPLPLSRPPYGGWALFGDVPATADASMILDVTRQYVRAVEWTPEDGWKPEFRGDLTLSESVGGGSGSVNEMRPYVLGWTHAPVFLRTPLTSTSWDGDAFSTTGKTLIDLSAVFGLPAGVKAILARLGANDSGSAASNCFVGLSPSSVADLYALVCKPYGRPNDVIEHEQGVVPCDANGDVYYQCLASGAGTLDIVFQIWGYWQ
jgi:hypothetical protein